MRDTAAIAAIILTLPYIGLTTPADVTLGIAIFLWGQLAASVITWGATLYLTARVTPRSVSAYLADLLPYIALSAIAIAPAWWLGTMPLSPINTLILEGSIALAFLTGICALTGSRIKRNALASLLHRN